MEQLVSLDLRLREIKATDAEMKDTVKELVTQTQQAESRVAKARSKLSAKRKRATEMKILRDEVHQLIGIPSLLREVSFFADYQLGYNRSYGSSLICD